MTKQQKHWQAVCEVAAESPAVRNPMDAVKAIRKVIEATNGYAFEHIIAVFLDNQNKILGSAVCGIGGFGGSEMTPSIMFKKFFNTDGATTIILGHNHPSGTCTPSTQDRHFSEGIGTLAKSLGVVLLDNIVVTHNDYCKIL